PKWSTPRAGCSACSWPGGSANRSSAAGRDNLRARHAPRDVIPPAKRGEYLASLAEREEYLTLLVIPQRLDNLQHLLVGDEAAAVTELVLVDRQGQFADTRGEVFVAVAELAPLDVRYGCHSLGK